jgi:hypothetical protein
LQGRPVVQQAYGDRDGLMAIVDAQVHLDNGAALAWLGLIVMLVLAPETQDGALRLPPGARRVSLVLLSALISGVMLGVVKRWRRLFWLLLIANLAGVLGVAASLFELLWRAAAHGSDLVRRVSSGDRSCASRAWADHVDRFAACAGYGDEYRAGTTTSPRAPHEYHGRAVVASCLRVSAAWRQGRPTRLVPTRANTQLAFGYYLAQPDGSTARATSLLVLTLRANQISGLTRFLTANCPACSD